MLPYVIGMPWATAVDADATSMPKRIGVSAQAIEAATVRMPHARIAERSAKTCRPNKRDARAHTETGSERNGIGECPQLVVVRGPSDVAVEKAAAHRRANRRPMRARRKRPQKPVEVRFRDYSVVSRSQSCRSDAWRR